jgi:group I intron endonuclease
LKGQFIYKIINTANGKFYVGSTINTHDRFRNHRKQLRKNVHHSRHLQAAWNKYGEDAFVFEVIENIPEGESLEEAENKWLQEFVGKECCYNFSLYAGAPWRDVPKELTPNYQRKFSQAVRQRMSEAMKKYHAENPDANPMLGRKHTEESKEKNRQSKLANPTRAWLGKTRSEETKAKISAKQKGVPKAPGRKVSAEGLEKMKAAARRGADSHFYGKPPPNIEALQKKVYVRKPDGSLLTFTSLSQLRDEVGVSVATTIRACKSGKPVQTGVASGWVMSYIPIEETPVPPEYAHLPRTRQLAKEQGSDMYFTGQPCTHGHIAPRKTKGQCIECIKLEQERQKEKNKSKPKSDASKAAGKRYYERKKLAAQQSA